MALGCETDRPAKHQARAQGLLPAQHRAQLARNQGTISQDTVAGMAMTAPLSHPMGASAICANWILDRLTEARGVLALAAVDLPMGGAA